MGRFDDLKRAGENVVRKASSDGVANLAGDAVVKAHELVDGAEAVAKRAGLTKRNGEVSKIKVAATVVRPQKSVKRLLGATADEITSRRAGAESSPAPLVDPALDDTFKVSE